MTSGTPDFPDVDALLDRFIAAWHAGDAPSAADSLAEAGPDDRDELAALIAGFLELAPTVSPNPEAAARLADDPLVAKLSAMEGEWWDARGVSQAPAWGARLKALREAAGVSLTQLAQSFSGRFGLGADDAGRAPTVFGELEAGALSADGVTARAARALEEILGAARGALDGGGAPAMGGALMRSDLPDSLAEREQLGGLLRQLDDALPAGDGEAAETLSDLLGA